MTLHGIDELDGLLTKLRRTWPAVQVIEQQVVLRSIKSWGRLLDVDGRAIRTVAVDPWTDPGAKS
jgi:hypothetical protein